MQTTQAWSLLFIVKDPKYTCSLDESGLFLFQLENFVSAKGNNFTFSTLYPPLLASRILSSRLFS